MAAALNSCSETESLIWQAGSTGSPWACTFQTLNSYQAASYKMERGLSPPDPALQLIYLRSNATNMGFFKWLLILVGSRVLPPVITMSVLCVSMWACMLVCVCPCVCVCVCVYVSMYARVCVQVCVRVCEGFQQFVIQLWIQNIKGQSSAGLKFINWRRKEEAAQEYFQTNDSSLISSFRCSSLPLVVVHLQQSEMWAPITLENLSVTADHHHHHLH